MQQRLGCTAQGVVGDHLVLAVDGVWGERREADGDILGAFGPAGVSDALASAGEDRLPGVGGHRSAVVIDDHRTRQDQSDLVEFRRLEGLAPVGGRDHVGDRDGIATGVDPADVLIDDLSARNGDAGGFGDESRHAFTVMAGSAHEPV